LGNCGVKPMAMKNRKVSKLKTHPKSKVVRPGYINVYSKLSPQEMRGLKYKERYKREHPEWDETTVRLNRWMKEYLKRKIGVQVLDLGCGNGNYLIDEHRGKIDWAAGIDVRSKFTKKNVCLDEMVYGKAEELPWEENRFDAVISLWMLEHAEDPGKVLSEAWRVLKPGGIFLFATPNKESWLVKGRGWLKNWSRVAGIVEKLYGRKEEGVFGVYYRANDLKTLKKLLGEAGFANWRLELNYDPAYTSFNEVSYRISSWVDKALSNLGSGGSKWHIAGMARKRTWGKS
jgi:ubiquinone/menaquinone biosynthesis C-methylase UbiE